MDKFFTFSLPEDVKRLEKLTNDSNICVVSIIGKTPLHGSKSTVFKKLLDRETILDETNNLSRVKGCCDKAKKLVVLECFTGYDTDQLTQLIQVSKGQGDTPDNKEFLNEWDSVLHTKARVMLYAFHVSHIVIISIPGLSFDTSYIRLFRALDHTRNKLHLDEELSKFDLPKSWCSAGRPVCPRVLFLFNPVTKAMFKESDTPAIKKKQIQLEDLIYRVLRKTRIITNNPKSSLFALPANQEFVHIMRANDGRRSKENVFDLFDLCTSGQSLDSVKAGDCEPFKEMLMQHVDLVHGAGFDDSMGRNPVSNPCHVGKLKSWLAMASHLYTLLVDSQAKSEVDTEGGKSRLSSVFADLKSTIEIEQRFSDGRCMKVLQFADKAYRENLPEHYTEGVHQEQLAKAQHVMKSGGRGPALQSYLARIKRDCTNYWQNGHRLCESTSLSGNHCIHELHRLPDEPITKENEKLPCCDHSTSVSFTVACNCGRTTRNIGDPFTAKEANYLVYEDLAKDCCSQLASIPFPVYTAAPVSPPLPSATPTHVTTPPSSAADKLTEVAGEDNSGETLTGKTATLTIGKLKQEEEELTTISDHQSYFNSLSQGNMRHDVVSKTDVSVPEDHLEIVSEDVEEEKHGYLNHMLTNTSTKGLLPDYPSWALTCLGTYSSYSPTAGLDQPGFLPSTNFLLPWEVVIKGIVKGQTWPHVTEPTTHKQRKKMVPKKHVVDTTAKIYIGDAYICPQGHRFMCSSPDKVIKVPGSAVKDNANKLLTMDMPLYTPCPNNDGCVGQLRHIYVCTPEIESLVVSLLPKIQPASAVCPLFLPTHDGPIKLPANGVWVMRLPHFYVDEQGHYPLPTDTASMVSCRLLKGTFNFRNTSDPLL